LLSRPTRLIQKELAAADQQRIARNLTPVRVNYLTYWMDEEGGKLFCLVEAPDPETAVRVHRKAHGLVADHI
jgi:hypothetical protein